MFYIGDVCIKGRAIAGPMAGYTNKSYRKIALENGAALAYAEMVSDKALKFNSKRTYEMIENEDLHPVSMQIFGADTETLVNAAKVVDTSSSADIIDINLGCPAPKVIRAKSGSYWLKNPAAIYEMLVEVVKAVKKPVTVKIRIGWDSKSINVVEVAKLAEKAGVKAIAVHARTKAQLYTGQADWDYIRQVKEAVSIPVIGNGDVHNAIEAKKMLDVTGCDAVMVARGSLGNPWVFSSINDYLEGKEIREVTMDERIDMCKYHAQLLVKEFGENKAVKDLRSVAAFYMKGIPFAKPYKVDMCKIESIKELEDILELVRSKSKEM